MTGAPGPAWIEADWPAPPGVRALVTRRHGAGVSAVPFDSFNLGVRNGDDVAAVAANRRELVERLRLPGAPHWLRQVHGTAVVHVPGDALAGPPDTEPEADASVTSARDTVLAVLTADCLPVLIAAREGGEIAAAHAGWRGLAAGVLENTVAAMTHPARDLQVWLGPAAGPQAYEVGTEVRDAFLAHSPDADSAFIATRAGHWRIDLYALARQRLAAAGIPVSSIHGGQRCTISEPDHFFSHRRDGRSGRIASLIWME